MEPFAATFRATLPASQREALVKLLTDEDPAVYQTVRSKIISTGESATRATAPPDSTPCVT